MWFRRFGNTGLTTSAVGLGAGALGLSTLSDRQAHALLMTCVEHSVLFWDTARSYGLSEKRIGEFLRCHGRPDGLVISTKLGYGIDGVEDWTADAVTRGVEEALRTLSVDVLDIVHLHSCDVPCLQRGAVIDALSEAKQRELVKAIAYSGDNEPLAWAVRSGRFDSVQASLNVCDQRSLEVFPEAWAADMGVIAKRPLANAPWRFDSVPTGDEAEFYWHRWQDITLANRPMRWHELALRFAVWHDDVDVAIVGTQNPAHVALNVALARRGPLDPRVVQEVHRAFFRSGADWEGRI